MSPSSSYPPDSTPALLEHFTDYALSHGLTVAHPTLPATAIPAPTALYPSLFPRAAFDAARDVMPAYNDVYMRIASDDAWLGQLVSELAAVDTFMADLYRVHTQVAAEGFTHPYSLGLFRSDYMLHAPSGDVATAVPHQVEFNTIASSFGGLASRVADLHRHLVAAGAYPPTTPALTLDNVPANPAAAGLAAGLADAHEAYGPPASDTAEKAVVFITQPGERNVFDQRWLEYLLLATHGVRVHRLTLADVPDRTYIWPGDGERRLFLRAPHGDVEVSVVYFRAGYAPDDYGTPAAWEARHTLERSRAIKCPTVATQLAGAKKVQQVLAAPGVLERFCGDAQARNRLRGTFAAIHPLDASEAGLRARRLALETPDGFVLKPQREGGGNNVYRARIPAFLRSVPQDAWAAYILMELIEPPPAAGVIVRAGEARRGHVIAELGVYGVALWRPGPGAPGQAVDVRVNRECGWLLRTKARESEEGGVAAGFGCVDGVCLVD